MTCLADTLSAVALESLLQKLAGHDLAGVPVYVVFDSDLPEDLRVSCDVAWGYTNIHLAVAFERLLVTAGRWRGYGGCVVLNDTAVAGYTSKLSAGDADLATQLYANRILSILMHESAHVLCQPLDTSPPDVQSQSIANTLLESFKCARPQLEDRTVPFVNHGACFIRAMSHLDYRAKSQGIYRRAPDRSLFDHLRYELSPLCAYRHALYDELETFDGSFAELRATKPPWRFVDLWRSDVQSWFKRSDQDKTREAADRAMRLFDDL